MFGYWIVNKGDWFKYQAAFHRIGTLHRWLSGFKDLDLLWDWIREPHHSVEELRAEYARARKTDVYGRLDALKAANRLSASVQTSKEAIRYALATFRALDQYTFENSDHALLIAAAVEKLEDAEGELRIATTSAERADANSTQTPSP